MNLHGPDHLDRDRLRDFNRPQECVVVGEVIAEFDRAFVADADGVRSLPMVAPRSIVFSAASWTFRPMPRV